MQWRSQAGAHWGTCPSTRGRAPPVQVCMRIIGADSIVVDRESGLEIEWRSMYVCIIHRITSLVRSTYASLPYKCCTLHYDMASEPTWEAMKF